MLLTVIDLIKLIISLCSNLFEESLVFVNYVWFSGILLLLSEDIHRDAKKKKKKKKKVEFACFHCFHKII